MLGMDGGGCAFLVVVAWQTTVLLTLGIAGILVWRRHPARAHRILLLTVLACFVAPVLTFAVRSLDWGMLGTLPVTSANPATMAETADTIGPIPPGAAPMITEMVSVDSAAASLPGTATLGGRSIGDYWSSAWPWLWAIVSLVAVVRFTRALALARRMVSRAAPVDDPTVKSIVAAAAETLGVKAAPTVASSDSIHCPMIWCWRPTLLLPATGLADLADRDSHSIIVHELAHLKRRDHLACMAVELLLCILPWHPLAWWAKRRQHHLAEQVCDTWVLARGGSATGYAESLLALIPQCRPAMALAVVRSRNGLVRRIKAILADHLPNPQTGLRWSAAAMLAVVAIVSAIALGQPRAFPSEVDRIAEQTHAQSKELSAQSAPTSVESSADGRLVAAIGDGITVELLAVSNLQVQYQKDDGEYWWSPGGPRIAEPSFRRSMMCLGNYEQFDFAVKISGLREYDIVARNYPTQRLNRISSFPLADFEKNALPNTHCFSIPECSTRSNGYPERASINIGLAAGRWEKVDQWAERWTGYAPDDITFGSNGAVVIALPQQVGSHVELMLTHGYTDFAVRMIAVDSDGNTHVATMWRGGDGLGLARRVCRFESISLADITRFEFQKRPYDQWVEFPSVVLQPDHIQDVFPWARLKSLLGRPAPELRKIKGWKNGGPITLADLRGKVVILDFWHYQCGSCLVDMPKLMALHDRYARQGLTIIGIHNDSVDSIEQMDEKLRPHRKKLWGGRDIPFLVALDGGGSCPIAGTDGKEAKGATTAAYAVRTFPTSVLIDKNGTVVGIFDPDSPEALDQLASMLAGIETN